MIHLLLLGSQIPQRPYLLLHFRQLPNQHATNRSGWVLFFEKNRVISLANGGIGQGVKTRDFLSLVIKRTINHRFITLNVLTGTNF